MAFIDIESVLQPVSAESPAGENLEYDPAFLELDRLALGKPEQQIGDHIIPAEPPDYVAVLQRAAELLSRSKDLRVANHAARALLHRAGYDGLRQGLELIHGLLERYWAPLHPQLDPDDGNDPVMRVTALSGVCTGDLLSTLRSAPLIHSRSFGPIGLREVAIAAGELPQPEEGPSYEPSTIEAAFQEVDLESLSQLVESLQRSARALSRIEATFEANAGQRGPDFSGLVSLVRQATSAVQLRLNGRGGVAVVEAPASEGNGAAAEPQRAAPAARLEISSREDVLRALDQICAYYARCEPSSPLPMLLERCKRLVSMSFVDIIRDIVPDAMSQVELIAGKREEE